MDIWILPSLASMEKSAMDNIIYSLGAHVKLSRLYFAVELLYHRIGKCLKQTSNSYTGIYFIFKCIKDILRVSAQNIFFLNRSM